MVAGRRRRSARLAAAGRVDRTQNELTRSEISEPRDKNFATQLVVIELVDAMKLTDEHIDESQKICAEGDATMRSELVDVVTLDWRDGIEVEHDVGFDLSGERGG